MGIDVALYVLAAPILSASSVPLQASSQSKSAAVELTELRRLDLRGRAEARSAMLKLMYADQLHLQSLRNAKAQATFLSSAIRVLVQRKKTQTPRR